MTDKTSLPGAADAIERARRACYGRYGSDTTEINVGVLCELINALSAPAVETVAVQEAAKACEYCDDTGDVHGFDGEWRGRCICPAADASPLPVAPKAEPTPDAYNRKLRQQLEQEWADLRALRAAQPVGAVTDAMVDAYLQANDAYWRETDALPTRPDKWRNGTPREATRVSLAAALASPPRAIPAEQAAPTEPKECDLPPAGWHCTRGKGHEGPCAAVLMEGVSKEWCKAHPGGAAYIINTLAKRIDDAAHPHEAADRSAEARDAARYRWLREQDWFDGPLCVLRDPKRVLTRGVGLGADCPSRDRLDAAIDALAAQPVAGHRGDSNA